MTKTKDEEPPKIDKRIHALLYAIRHGHPPWAKSEDVDGAFESEDEWIMCCDHAYSGEEIAAMEAAGWIRTDGPRDYFGRRQTTAGPDLDAALARFVN